MEYPEDILLRSIQLNKTGIQFNRFPFSVPFIKSFTGLEFKSLVTFFVGENGSGKSTLLEAIAGAVGSITVGSESVDTDQSLAGVKSLSKALKLTWSKRTRRGFFMRSEDFFGYARRMAATREELQRDLEETEEAYKNSSPTAQLYARAAYRNELGAMKEDYGDDLDTYSHGESYLQLFQARFVPKGLYLLDEPEAPLSPIRQLSFLAMLKQMEEQKSQFIIATHSPIIMAYPGATILNFDGGFIQETAYEDVEHVRVTKSFLDNPERYLRHLLE